MKVSVCHFRVNMEGLFDLILYVPVNSFPVILEWVFLGRTSTKNGLMCLAQRHNAVPLVSLEPTTARSPVKHSTTEPMPSLKLVKNFPHTKSSQTKQ